MQSKTDRKEILTNLKKSAGALTLAVALAAFGAGCTQMNRSAQNSSESNAAQTNTAQSNQTQTNQTAPNAPNAASPVASYSEVVKRVTPAVVTIQSAHTLPLAAKTGKLEFAGSVYGAIIN